MEKKLLELNAYGVEEMSSVEMRETNGGGDDRGSGTNGGMALGIIIFALAWFVPIIVEVIRNR